MHHISAKIEIAVPDDVSQEDLQAWTERMQKMQRHRLRSIAGTGDLEEELAQLSDEQREDLEDAWSAPPPGPPNTGPSAVEAVTVAVATKCTPGESPVTSTSPIPGNVTSGSSSGSAARIVTVTSTRCRLVSGAPPHAIPSVSAEATSPESHSVLPVAGSVAVMR